MIKYLVWVDENGDIKMVKPAKGANNPEHGFVDPVNGGWMVLHYLEDIDNMGVFVAERYWHHHLERFEVRPPSPNKHSVWGPSGWSWSDEDLMDEIRLERRKRLYDCDWAVLPDVDLSISDSADLLTYRLALRNITNTVDITTLSSVDEVDWPTKPEFLG